MDQHHFPWAVYNQWTGILEWTTGLTYFWFSHIFGWFNWLSLAKEPLRNLYPTEIRTGK